ncbi:MULTISPECIES: hypothetical protein [Halobacillus]|uniref:hypothetical protein n=1 Tax=Halobacillus sp. Cin3 TaxID=2928441 RepID=UPI00048606A4|nr:MULTISPECIES: hypothetical protein [Halobacillus]
MLNQQLQNSTGVVGGETDRFEYTRCKAYKSALLFFDPITAEALSIFAVQHKWNGRISLSVLIITAQSCD